MRHQRFSFAKYGPSLLLVFGLLTNSTSQAQSAENVTSLRHLIEVGLQNSADRRSAAADANAQEKTADLVSRLQTIPQISLSASYQDYHFDSLRDSGGGKLTSNDGQKPAYGITVSYDLQKFLNPDTSVAKELLVTAKYKERLTDRDIVRNIKKSFYSIVELQAEIDELNRLIKLFSKIDGVLQKQKRIGIYNEIERKQFQTQQSILTSDLNGRLSDLDAAYFQLSSTMNVESKDLMAWIPQIKDAPNLKFVTTRKSPSDLAALNDADILSNLDGGARAAKAEYDGFSSVVLPTLYVRQSREMPTMPSSDGFQNISEIGLSFPIDSLLTRSVQKSVLHAKADKAKADLQKSLLEYRNLIRLNAMKLERYQSQASQLEKTQVEASQLLDKAFVYYSQKRIDALGTLDLFQKHLQATRNLLSNTMLIQTTDAELEYLVGGGLAQ